MQFAFSVNYDEQLWKAFNSTYRLALMCDGMSLPVGTERKLISSHLCRWMELPQPTR